MHRSRTMPAHSTRRTGPHRVLQASVLTLVLALGLASCASDGNDADEGNVDQTATAPSEDPAPEPSSDSSSGNTSDGSDDPSPTDSAGTATVAVNGQQASFDVVACARDLVVPEADGTVVATIGGVSPAADGQARRAMAEATSLGNGIASTVESLLPSLEAALEAGPVLGYERFETTDGAVEDRVRVVLADGTTYAGVGQLEMTVGDGVTASGSLPAVSRASGTTPTPYEGEDVGELTIDASCG